MSVISLMPTNEFLRKLFLALLLLLLLSGVDAAAGAVGATIVACDGSTSIGVSVAAAGSTTGGEIELRPGMPPLLSAPPPDEPNSERTPELCSFAHRSLMSVAGAAAGSGLSAESTAAAALPAVVSGAGAATSTAALGGL